MRKVLGGGMRQVGVLAAAGIVALETMIDRLADDHRRARQLAEGLRRIDGLLVDKGSPQTNMIFLELTPETGLTASQAAERLRDQGVLVGAVGLRRFRLVTHYWIDDQAVDHAVSAFMNML